MKKLIMTALVALAPVSAMAPAPVLAQEIITSIEVPFGDLDLSSLEGQAALETRLDAATRAVCGEPRQRDLKGMVAWEECRAKAEAEAKAQISFASPFDGIELASRF